MNSLANQQLVKFENAYKTLTKEYRWSSSQLINIFTALIYTLSDREFDREIMDKMHRLMKENTGFFSHYRSYDRFFMSALLHTKFENPEENFIKLLELEDQLKQEGFTKGTYSGLASYILLTSVNSDSVHKTIRRAKQIYGRMRDRHFWLTGQDDYPLAVLLAASGEEVESIESKVEGLFEQLHNSGFSKTNSLQFLSHILSFGKDNMEDKVEKCKSVVNYFKSKKIKINSTHYGTVGLMALMFNNEYEFLEEILEVIDYLKSRKEFKWTSKEILLLIASSIITAGNIEKYKEHEELLKTNLGLTIQAVIAAQTAAMVASISAITAASAASSSS